MGQRHANRELPIVVRGAARRFGAVEAVRDVTLEIPRGVICGLVGPSGSGKTTLLRMLTGTLRPTSGELRVLGESPWRFRAHTRERIGYMPQNFVLYPDLTAEENVSFVAALFGMYWFKRRRRVREVLELVGLDDVRGRRASLLSGGMQRRLALAAALVHEPLVLFVDEPTAGLDPILRGRVWTELRRLAEDGRTLLVTTQYVGEAENCDLVALLSGGELLAFATPDELRRHVYGGEILDVRTSADVTADVLAGVPDLRDVKQRGSRRLIVVSGDAAAATPRIVEAVGRTAGTVASIERYDPTFDEVFTILVERHAEQHAA
ncbi:MAG TPA: ABC transporter ATP-binding protein [Candidatus Limnocylindria bacterium]|nr:ABC transporter ATP-binding protein [Candidatus Limnocylindria bacterium]